jgi:TatD DNase family protein
VEKVELVICIHISRLQVGINLSDPVFRGMYHGKKAHEDDLHEVVQRALNVGCTKMMVTGSSLKESRHAVDIAKRYRT